MANIVKHGNNYKNYEKGQLIGKSIYLYEIECPSTYKVKKRFARFICPCGNEYEASIEKVKGRGDRCPECAKRNLEAIGKNNFKHGMTGKIPLYGVWQGIKSRCYNPKNEFYYCYGERGIGVFDGWMHDFKAFYDYVNEHLGKRPSIKHSIDRINNEKWYEPGNVKWSSPKQQANNVRTNRHVEHEGETKTMSEWADIYGFNRVTFRDRLIKYGYSFEKAISFPINGHKKGKRNSNK